jgi:hypothetical protein
MHVERRTVLPCCPDEAWRFLVDWERQGDWMVDVGRIEVVSANREGAGVRLRCPAKVFGVPAFTEVMTVGVWEPPRHLVIRHGDPLEGEGTWWLTPQPDGTLFRWAEDVRLDLPLVGELAALGYRPLMGWLMERSMNAARGALIAAGPRPLSAS